MTENSKPRNPNIFDFATKELSQDAMICWLIRWAHYRFAGYRSEASRLRAGVHKGITARARS